MFSDELKGSNAARKRADETKIRRQRLKDEQNRKQKTLAAAASYGITNATTTASCNTQQITSISTLAHPFTNSSFSAPKPIAASKELSAVERAQRERELRHRIAHFTAAAIRIQASFRRYKETTTWRRNIRQQLTHRLSDLKTLRNIIRETKGVEYVLPQATTRTLCSQLIFLSTMTDGRPAICCLDVAKNANLLLSFLENALLPGLKGNDASLDPISTWPDTPEGRFRLNNLIRLCLLAISDLCIPMLDTVFCSLNAMLGVGNSEKAGRVKLHSYCRSLLLSKHITPTLLAPSIAPKLSFAVRDSSMDLISILRHHLMFVVGSTPIPAAAKELREACISPENCHRASAFVKLTWKTIDATRNDMGRKLLRIRFLVEILTVPLLTWKVSVDMVQYLLAEGTNSTPSPIVACIEALIQLHADLLTAGKLNNLLFLHEVSLTICPATSSQCLLANFVLMAHANSTMNGNQPSDNGTMTLYVKFLATLVDILPLSTFSSRDSSVEWMDDGKGHHTPIVISTIILEQCKLLLVDSFVRRLFQQAIGRDVSGIELFLAKKDEQDLKHEVDLLEEGGAMSAATFAAKEARLDRNKSFWNSSKWAKNLSKSVSSFLSVSDSSSASASKTKGNGTMRLLNTSSVAKKLAGGESGSGANAYVAISSENLSVCLDRGNGHCDTKFMIALCRLYGVVLARWGGNGQNDIVAQELTEQITATSKPESITLSLLNVLSFSTALLRTSWGVLQSEPELVLQIQSVIGSEHRGTQPTRVLKARPEYCFQNDTAIKYLNGDGPILLYIFANTLAHSLIVTDDAEIHDMDRPLPLHQLRRFIQLAKKLLYRASCVDHGRGLANSNCFGLSLIAVSARAMRDLYDRSSRRPICDPKMWLVPDLLEKELRHCKTHDDYVALLKLPVLRVCPQLVSFKRRLKIFERIITTNRVAIQGVNDGNPFNNNPLRPGIPVYITRGRLLEDGLATMKSLGTRMRQRISVHYVNEAGAREAGVDAGGLFKEFWTDLCAIAFDLNFALFTATEGSGCVYPNPSSGAAHGSDHIQLFEFVGRILGKALYEGITIQPKFAHFFLSFLRGDYNYLHMLPDLSTVDYQLYNNLMFLKTYDGDAADLCLSFTITTSDFGGNEQINLISNGSDVEVTNVNKHHYIGLVTKHYVVDRVKEQSEAFTRGLWEVIDSSWLRIFNEPELQVLISGASDGKIDVDDMKSHTKYIGGYTGIDRTVTRFWSVIKSFGPREQAELLRFVTSCERPPPLGFASMNPPFTIQRVGIMRDGDKLPSASTCFNTLKLPTYSSEKVLKDRLLYAIKSGAGFELT
ncbi:hypothetical protein MPSEU_000568600 [Mayamaea pseudoterrestris]|nr:hypothetical protein MPSEU_000568600 [Mayamaea pseudoterrestris]